MAGWFYLKKSEAKGLTLKESKFDKQWRAQLQVIETWKPGSLFVISSIEGFDRDTKSMYHITRTLTFQESDADGFIEFDTERNAISAKKTVVTRTGELLVFLGGVVPKPIDHKSGEELVVGITHLGPDISGNVVNRTLLERMDIWHRHPFYSCKLPLFLLQEKVVIFSGELEQIKMLDQVK